MMTMDFSRLFEKRMKKILKEEEEVKDIQTKQSGVLKRGPQQPSDEKVVNIQTKQSGVLKRSTLEEGETEEIPVKTQGVGVLKRNKHRIGEKITATVEYDKEGKKTPLGVQTVEALKQQKAIVDGETGYVAAPGWKFVDPNSKTNWSLVYVGTPEEQKANQSTVYKKQVGISQKIEDAIASILQQNPRKIKRVGNIQDYVNKLRAADPSFPKKTGDLTNRLGKILTWITTKREEVKKILKPEAATPPAQPAQTQPATEQPVATAVTQPAQAAPERGTFTAEIPFSPFGEKEPETPTKAAASTQKSGFVGGNIRKQDDQTYIFKDNNGKEISIPANEVELTPEEIKAAGSPVAVEYAKTNKRINAIRKYSKQMQESKLIRKMIIQEVRKALRK